MTVPRILFLVNGLGLGNSTRCHAIIQRLQEMGAEIHVVTSGNGLWYFRSVDEIAHLHEIETLYYGVKDDRISIARTLGSVGDFIEILRRNAQKLESIISEWRPDIAITDSVYTYRPFRKNNIPLVALNNADVIHQAYHLFSNRPRSIRAQFWAVEEPDYLFHRLIPDLVISPNLDPSLNQTGGKFRRVGPIVRRGLSLNPPRATVERVLIMLSGSRFGSPVIFDRKDWPFRIDIVGRSAPERWSGAESIHFHGRLLDNKALIENSDLIIVNGGFSAISESFSLRKPLCVIPVANHAEQWVNAQMIERLGVGTKTSEIGLDKVLGAAAQLAEQYADGYKKIGNIPDGAAQAATHIMSLIR